MLRRLLVLAVLMLALAIPTTAHADVACPGSCGSFEGAGASSVADLPYKGWTYLNLNYCPPNLACTMQYRSSMVAWSWTGTAWRQTSLRQGRVYVWPYTGQWRWAWTAETGWVAVTGGRFELRAPQPYWYG